MRAGSLIGQSGYHVPQAGQGLVDLLRLFQTLTRRSCHSDTLATSQVNQVQLAYLDLLRGVIIHVLSIAHNLLLLLNSSHLLHDYDKHSM
jgi:hypothetical protein